MYLTPWEHLVLRVAEVTLEHMEETEEKRRAESLRNRARELMEWKRTEDQLTALRLAMRARNLRGLPFLVGEGPSDL